MSLYTIKKAEGINFSSQCLGSCGDYAVDAVHVPRIQEDDKPENQCSDFLEGKVKHFIEIDKDGNIIVKDRSIENSVIFLIICPEFSICSILNYCHISHKIDHN